MRPRGRNRGLEMGVMMLLLEMWNVGFNNIPTVTLGTIVAQVLLYVGVINPPWDKWQICISAEKVIKYRDWRSLIFSSFEHADDLHLYYNMISFLVKGRSLENQYGSKNFCVFLGFISVLTSCVYVALGKLANELLLDLYYMKVCAIGFSGVIFALKVVASQEAAPSTTYIQGLNVSTRYAAWLELILIHLLVPNASFMGHLAGIIAGILYTKTPVGSIIDNIISTITGQFMVHTPYYYGHSENFYYYS